MTTGRWSALAFAALGLSACYAILLVVLRSPLVAGFSDLDLFFQQVLVSHVQLAAGIWLLALAAERWSAAGRQGAVLVWMAVPGVVLLVLTPFLTGAPVLLVNYLPAIDHPLFWMGGGVFVMAVGIAALAFLLAHKSLRLETDPAGWQTAAAIALVVAVLDGLSHFGRGWGAVAWSSGHWLMFVFLAMGVDAWHALCGRLPVPKLRQAARAYSTVVVLAAIWIGLLGESQAAYSRLMQWALWPLPLAAVIAVLWTRWRRAGPFSAPEIVAVCSIVLLLMGGVFGALIRADGLMVPAHYHAVLGALTAALLAGQCVSAGRLAKPVFHALLAYLAGKALLAVGLALQGWAGGVRKSPWISGAALSVPELLGSVLMVAGGALAVAGIMWIMGVRLLLGFRWLPLDRVAKVQVRNG